MRAPMTIAAPPAPRRLLRAFRTPVRGHVYAPRPPDADQHIVGATIRLMREPGNPADPYAVAVWVSEPRGAWRIGYLDRSVAAWIAPRLDLGLAVDGTLEGWVSEPDGRWHRPLARIGPMNPLPAASGTSMSANEAPMPRHPGVRRRVVR